jgi:hypothetical protein
MKSLTLALLLNAIFLCLAPAQEAPPVPAALVAANGLIRRVLPQQADGFSLLLDTPPP